MWKKLLLILIVLNSCQFALALDLKTDELRIFEQVNAERRKRGLNELVLVPLLKRAADVQATNMVERQRMSHELPVSGQRTVQDRVEYVGYRWTSIGENIAMGMSADSVMNEWMHSSGHRANILGNFKEFGVSVRYSTGGDPYYCQVFGISAK
jgi:uncharacterized protein YkwD